MRPSIPLARAQSNNTAHLIHPRRAMTLGAVWLASILLPLAAQGAPTSATASNGSATVTGNSPVTLNVPLARSGDLNDNVFLRYQTQDGTAKAGSDYSAANGTLRLSPGASSANIPVQLLGASSGSADKQFSLKLSSAVGVGPAPNFATQKTFSVGANPQSVAMADINGDGKTDQIVVNNTGNSVSVLLNTTTPGATTPTFATQQTVATGSAPTSVTIADINGDGKLDLIVANSGDNTLSVLLNTTAPGATTPSFAAQQTLATGNAPTSVTTADVNGDGKPDLIVANSADNTVSVLLNTTTTGATTLTFATPKTFSTGTYPASVKTADLNGDGKPDLIVANKNSNTVSVLLNTTVPGATTPGFATQQTFATGNAPASVTTADVNGDGKPDLIVANSADNTLSVLLNTTTTGAITLTFATQKTFATGNQPQSVKATDVNGDGKPDLMVANLTDNTVSVLLNITAPGATVPNFAAQQSFATGAHPYAVTTSDVNGDGKPDLMVANGQDSTTSVLLNTTAAPTASAPSFAAQHTFASLNVPVSIATADLNGDGKPDAISLSNTTSNSIYVSLNLTQPGATTPSFAAPQRFSITSNPVFSDEAIRVADVNGDGKPDLLAIDQNSYFYVLLNTTLPGATTITFSAAQGFPIPVPVTGNAIAVTDINGDGKPDWVVGNATGQLYAQLNTTPAGATTVTTTPWVQLPGHVGQAASISASDVNGDGKPDLTIADGGDNVWVLLNTTTPGATTPSFSAPQRFIIVTSAGTVAPAVMADINGDGKPDIIAANAQYKNIVALLNDTPPGASTASFRAPQAIATSIDTWGSLTASDVNGDGRPDIIFTNPNHNSISVLLNTTAPGATTPSFTSPTAFSTSSFPTSLAVTDINGDGTPDLLVANQNSNTDSALLNTQYTASVSPASVTGTIHYAIPQLTLGSSKLAFGNHLAGSNATRTVTLSNNGSGAASLTGFTLSGADASRFSQTNNCGSSLAIGTSCIIKVTYAPNAAATDSATLNISSNASSSPDTVALSGTGTDSAPITATPLASHGGPGAFGPGSLLAMVLMLGIRGLRRRRSILPSVIAATVLSAGLIVSQPAQAAPHGAWYLGGQINTIATDPARHTSTNGFRGWGLLAGRQFGPHWALELAGSYHDTSPRTQTATANWTTYGLDALWYPGSVHRVFSPFLLLGGGHMSQFRGDGSEPSNSYFSVGLGMAIHPTSLPFTLRADVQDQRTGWGNYMDRVFSLGFVIPFSVSPRLH